LRHDGSRWAENNAAGPKASLFNELHDIQMRRQLPRALLVIFLLVFLALSWRAGKIGVGAFLTSFAATSNVLSKADSAVRASPSSADAHYVRGVVLEASDLPAAVSEHFEAVKARPDDYALWLSLARALELNGEVEKAVAAARQATTLAPAYSQPHYQLGNLLLRAGRTSEAFAELRLAGISDPLLMPGIIDLAWSVSSGNAQFVEAAIAPKTSDGSLILAMFLRQHQQVEPALRWFMLSGPAGEADRRAYIAELITNGQFEAAAQLWKVDNSEAVVPDVLRNPGFEKEVNLNNPGFDWNASPALKGVRFALDTQNPAEGRSALKVEFSGDAPVGSLLFSQIVVVAANTKYELQFQARSESIVSGSVPQIFILDAVSRVPLGESPLLTGNSEGWRSYAISFTSGPQTKAVRIGFQRQLCSSTPCPIFGRLWLDSLVLRKT
jgi:tetratricopeptide (TPR) repeat protein